MADEAAHTSLHRYVELNDTYYRIYERYRPDLEALAQLREACPAAHVVTATRYACPDCARNVPRMARIAEHLPGWTWEVIDTDHADAAQQAALGVTAVPTFIVYAADGRELGRIVENPTSGSLLADLLELL